MNINYYGWNDQLQKDFEQYKIQGYTVGRVISEHKQYYQIVTNNGDQLAEVSGKFRYVSSSRGDMPAVGDWVVVSEQVHETKAIIHAILPRFSKFSRKIAGATIEEQIVAVNIDVIFLVQSLNQDFNPRRLERYLIMAWESGATPVIILTKADLCNDVDSYINEVNTIAFGVPIHVISVFEQDGLDELTQYFNDGKTVALLGSSGTGKSTLTNFLLGEEQQIIQDIRNEDGKGRHATTNRALFLLPNGGLIMDTPGMRELQLWEAAEGLTTSFVDIETIAESCHFRDCSHQNEPKCAVKQAIEDGELKEERLKSYFKLQKELAYIERKNHLVVHHAKKEKSKKIINRIKKK